MLGGLAGGFFLFIGCIIAFHRYGLIKRALKTDRKVSELSNRGAFIDDPSTMSVLLNDQKSVFTLNSVQSLQNLTGESSNYKETINSNYSKQSDTLKNALLSENEQGHQDNFLSSIRKEVYKDYEYEKKLKTYNINTYKDMKDESAWNNEGMAVDSNKLEITEIEGQKEVKNSSFSNMRSVENDFGRQSPYLHTSNNTIKRVLTFDDNNESPKIALKNSAKLDLSINDIDKRKLDHSSGLTIMLIKI